MRGVPLEAVQELLGHSTILMTMRYAHLAPEITHDAVNLLDPRTVTSWPLVAGVVAASAES
jgi:site-specific recombinase XerD